MNTNIAWGGGEKWHFNTSQHVRSFADICFIVNKGSALESKLARSMVTKRVHGTKLSFLNPWKIISLYLFFKRNKIDCVFLNLPQDMKLGSIAAKLAGVKKIIYRRGMPHEVRASFINKFLLKKCVTQIIANSEAVKESVYKNIPSLKEKITIVYNVDEGEFSQKKYPEDLVIGSLGRLTYQKGHDFLVEVAAKLKKRGVRFKVLIGGVGEEEKKIKAIIKKLSLDEYFSFLGQVESREFFSKIGILAFTSRFEGFSNVLVETLINDTPCIAFDVSSNSEVIIDSKSGLLVDAFNIDDFASKIIELHKNERLRSEISKNSKEILDNKLNYNKTLDQIKSYILSD